jgi:uncharacterized protein (TIGR02145 family)
MKKLIPLAIMFLTTFCLTAQDITISFQPKVVGTQIDSIWVTNQRTTQKVKLLGSESLLLDVPTGIDLIQKNEGNGYLYPNPGYGDATLVFSTIRDQDVMVSVYNISGQELGIKRQKLPPGQHTFRLIFPVIGLYTVSVQTDERRLSLKAVVMGVKIQECGIDYAGSENSKVLKIAPAGKTMDYKVGDILHNSVHSGENTTIVADSPAADKTYAIEFFKCRDLDNQNYPIVRIDNQVWMAENLKTTKYSNGVAIPNVTDSTTWWGLTSGAYCWYKNDIGNKNTYGAFYNWYAVNYGKLCPEGWHVPADVEWTVLTVYLTNNGYGYQGSGTDIAKSMAATTNWNHSDLPGSPGNDPSSNNSSGFSAIPPGVRALIGFLSNGTDAYWWSSTEVWLEAAYKWFLINIGISLGHNETNKQLGISVRCLKNL